MKITKKACKTGKYVIKCICLKKLLILKKYKVKGNFNKLKGGNLNG
ncbi:MAG TPA: hypothetical protein OIM45_05860 [Clostridiaceae bacterium]|jgi:hypothetical protein|nr:hypothetical protein [Clostridiaceae bacterium]